MSRSGSDASSGLAKGKSFVKQLLYAQRYDVAKDETCVIPELLLEDYILQERGKFCDLQFTEYLKNPNSNIQVLKLGLKSKTLEVYVYSNPLPFATTLEKMSARRILNLPKLPSICDLTIHAFVVFRTYDYATRREMWWSLEKNGHYTVLQHSSCRSDVVAKIYDIEQKKFVQRLEPVKELTRAASFSQLKNLFTAFWETCQFSTKYHLIKANCQNFASFVFKIANCEGKTWWTLTSKLVDILTPGSLKKGSGVESDAIRHYWLVGSEKRDLYISLIRNKDCGLITSLIEAFPINGRDSQGYTMLEWSRAFERKDIGDYLEKKGAIPSESFRRNVISIALQYSDSHDPKLSFDGIDVTSVNQTGDTVLHCALYGGKWKAVQKILEEFSTNCDFNALNSLNETPLHLAAKLESCSINKFEALLSRIDPEKVNIADHFGYTPLHYAVDVRLPNQKKIKLLLDKGADINSKTKKGYTALHFALWHKSATVTEELLSHVKLVDGKDVEDADVNSMDDYNRTALHYACWWSGIPVSLFKTILEKTTDMNGKDQLGYTGLISFIL